MEKDKFDIKMIDIESKSFEVNILMSGFVLEILESFNGMKSDIHAELPYFDPHKGYMTINSRLIYFDSENSLIFLDTEELQTPVLWDDLNIAAKEIVISELHHTYKSIKLYESLSGKEEMH